GFNSDGSSVRISYAGVESSYDPDRSLDHCPQMIVVCRNATDAMRFECTTSCVKMGQAVEETVGDDWFEGVQLQLSSLSCKCYCYVISDDLEGKLVDYFGNDWINLARHNRRSNLASWKIDFVQSRTRTTR